MRDAGESSGAAARFGTRARWGLAVGGVLLVLAVALLSRDEETAPATPREPSPSDALAMEVTRDARASSPPPVPVLEPLAPIGDALSAALREERVTVASGVVVTRIDQDRPWVCAGEPMGMAAHVGGESVPGAVSRWVWLTPGGAELHPGPKLEWRAPDRAGRYVVRYQVCKDLGGRRVGVLAERDVTIDVRECGAGERQADEPLRIEVAQRRNGAFTFRALYQGREPIQSYAWDFGDGTTASTREAQVEHAYSLEQLAPHEIKSFTVKLQAHRAGKIPLEATAFALTRAPPPDDEPSPVEVGVSRWRPLPDGEGWRSDVVIRNATPSDIIWERHERVTVRWDGQADSVTRPWHEVVSVDEALGLGGFRGHVTVSPSEVPPEVKQLLDTLYGTDGTGQEVVVSWSPYKSEAPPQPLPPQPPPPPKK